VHQCVRAYPRSQWNGEDRAGGSPSWRRSLHERPQLRLLGRAMSTGANARARSSAPLQFLHPEGPSPGLFVSWCSVLSYSVLRLALGLGSLEKASLAGKTDAEAGHLARADGAGVVFTPLEAPMGCESILLGGPMARRQAGVVHPQAHGIVTVPNQKSHIENHSFSQAFRIASMAATRSGWPKMAFPATRVSAP